MNQVTDHDIFNQIKEHLLTQNDKCMDNKYRCRYRGYLQKDINNIVDSIFAKYPHIIPEDFPNAWNDEIDNVKIGKCAVGAIIKDEFYENYFESHRYDSSDVESAIRNSNPDWNPNQNSFLMLGRLQYIHDSVEIDEWLKELNEMTSMFSEKGNYLP